MKKAGSPLGREGIKSPEEKERAKSRVSDLGVEFPSKTSEDSFDKYFSKELDLDEGKL